MKVFETLQMNIENADEHPATDSFAAGHELADNLGLFQDDQVYRIASQGLDGDGNGQLLTIGDQTLCLTDIHGQMYLEIHRSNIKTVDVAHGQGLWLTTHEGSFSVPKKWLHQVSDGDAEYIRNCLINFPPAPPIGDNGQVIPEGDWRNEQLSRMVGRIVMRAAEAEHNLGLVAAHAGVSKKINFQIFGRTGGPLTEKLKSLGNRSPAIADMGERYEAWSSLRNQLVHSIRPADPTGRPGRLTKKPNITKKDQSPGDLYTVAEQGLPSLVNMYYAYNWLYHDALRAYLQLATGVTVEELSMPDSVTGANRLPPSEA